jgi:hypothetical protein
MNLKGFFVDALGTALDLGIATPEDVVRHVTPDVLAQYLPRPLWARLLTACLGAPRVDAQLVVETIGVPNLCEHVPIAIIWSCISEVALRSLGREYVPQAIPTARSAPLAMTPPPAPEDRPPAPAPAPRPRGPSIPPPIAGSTPPAGIVAMTGAPAPMSPVTESLADVVAALEAEVPSSPPSRARTPTAQRFRNNSTGIGRLASNNARRPQAPITPAEPARPPFRRGSTEVTDYEIETEVGKEDWKSSLAVEDEQLVDWSATSDDNTAHGTDDYGRKR